jgi:hypothetical protein
MKALAMKRRRERWRWAFVAVMMAALWGQHPAAAEPRISAEPRIALVLGNSAYPRGPIANALADAGLVAEALNSIGFDIIEGADLNNADLRRAFADFLARVDAAGPDAVAFVYFSGYAVQFEGENYLIPVDARLARENDIPLEAVRLSDVLQPLAGSVAQAKIVTIDAARPLPLTLDVAPGLAPLEAPPGMLVAFSSSPATFAGDETPEPYGSYASAIAEMVRQPGLDVLALFTGIRVRTHGLTRGRQTPWHTAALPPDIVLLPDDLPADSPAAPIGAATAFAAPAGAAFPSSSDTGPPMADLGPEAAYGVAVQRDRLASYVEYVETYPQSVYAPGVFVLIRSRREALVWMRAREHGTREAYWSYLLRYPNGIYAADARRALRRLTAPAAPPPGFAPVEFAVPPPLTREPRDYAPVYPVVTRLPPNFVSPRPAYFASLPRAAPPRGPRLLPPPVGLPPVARLYEPPKRVGVPSGITITAPPVAGTPPVGPPGRSRVAPPHTGRLDTMPPAGQPVRRFEALPGGRIPATGRAGIPASPPVPATGIPPGGVSVPPASAVIRQPPPQQPVMTVPRVAPAPPPAAATIVRPVPPVVQRPAVVAPPPRPAPPQAAPATPRCRVVNGVERCR